MWPMFFGLSCCFVEMATSITARHDLSRFGAEVMRGSPRQADVMVIAGTVFKKVAPAILRLYEQMLEPRWVVSMGSCSNSGGMYDVYSVVQGVDTLLPVDGYVQGCPPRPESLLEALILLQKKIRTREHPVHQIVGRGGHSGTTQPVRIVGVTTADDPRGPGMEGTHPRGTIMRPGSPVPAAYFPPWTPPSPVTPAVAGLETVETGLRERLAVLGREEGWDGTLERLTTPATSPAGAPPGPRIGPTDTLTWRVTPEQFLPALRFLREQSSPRFRRLEFATALDDRPRGGGFRTLYHLAALEPGKPQVRLALDLDAGSPRQPSATAVFPAANWYEREMIDMFGVRFDGHPDPRRLWMPDMWPGHPLRKDHVYRGSEMKPFDAAEAAQWDDAINRESRIQRAGDGT